MQNRINRILEEIHPYKIYNNSKSVKGQWATYVPDPTKPSGRRAMKRNSLEALQTAIVKYYKRSSHLDMQLQAFFAKWVIFRRDETAVKPATIRRDMSLWRTHIKNIVIDEIQIKEYLVSDISAKLLYSFFRKITKDRKYTKKTICNIKGVLSGMLAYAVELGIIDHNPARNIDTKKLTYKPVPPKQDDVYTFHEAQLLLRYLEGLDDPYALAIRLDFNLFVRIGELAAIRWENVNIPNRRVFICQQITHEPELNDDLSFSNKKMKLEDYLKGYTEQGYRSEYLKDEAVEILKKAHEINPDGEFVFMPNGKPIVTLTFNKHLKKYCEAVGIPYRSSHKIRFYVASTAYNGENLVQISKMMGHSQVSTTLQYLRDVHQDDTCAELFNKLGKQDMF